MLRQVSETLREAGAGPEDVLRVQCFLKRADDFAAWNRLWGEFFPPPRPARTTVVCDFTVPGMLIEIEVTAGLASA